MSKLAGDLPQNSEILFSAVYEELKRIARHQLHVTRADVTLCTTELVHEVFLKFEGQRDIGWSGRAHFFGAASRAMRQVLVDFARHRRARKRGGDWQIVSLRDADAAAEIEIESILELDEALARLETANSRLARIVELRFFAGLPESEIADLLGVSRRTVERDWLKARMFLLRELEAEDRR